MDPLGGGLCSGCWVGGGSRKKDVQDDREEGAVLFCSWNCVMNSDEPIPLRGEPNYVLRDTKFNKVHA